MRQQKLLQTFRQSTGVNSLLICVLIWLCFWGCRLHPIDPDAEENDLPAVSGYVSPNDSIVQISVRRTRPLNTALSSGETAIKNATVQVAFQNKTLNLRYDSAAQSYRGIAHFKPKDTVKLLVRFSDGKEAYAETTIPDLVNEVLYRYMGNQTFELNWQASIKSSFYNVYIESASAGGRRIDLFIDPLVPEKLPFKTDTGLDQIAITAKYTSSDIFANNVYARTNVNFAIAVLDSASYNFNTDYLKQDLLTSSPFQSPFPVFNNIKGGVGVFGSFCLIKKNVKLNQI